MADGANWEHYLNGWPILQEGMWHGSGTCVYTSLSMQSLYCLNHYWTSDFIGATTWDLGFTTESLESAAAWYTRLGYKPSVWQWRGPKNKNDCQWFLHQALANGHSVLCAVDSTYFWRHANEISAHEASITPGSGHCVVCIGSYYNTAHNKRYFQFAEPAFGRIVSISLQDTWKSIAIMAGWGGWYWPEMLEIKLRRHYHGGI
jgi:hypothetical protein